MLRELLIYATVIVTLELGLWLAKIYWHAVKKVRAERRAEGR